MNYNRKYKVVLLGETGVGKTSILNRFINNTYNPHTTNTIGAQYSTYIIRNLQTRLDIWDTAGQERFRSLIQLYIRAAQIILLVINVNDSLDEINRQIDYWYKYIKDNCEYFLQYYQIILIFNKCDISNKYNIPDDSFRDDKRFFSAVAISCRTNINFTNLKEQLEACCNNINTLLGNNPNNLTMSNGIRLDNKYNKSSRNNTLLSNLTCGYL